MGSPFMLGHNTDVYFILSIMGFRKEYLETGRGRSEDQALVFVSNTKFSEVEFPHCDPNCPVTA